MPVYSPSRLSTYENCPRQYAFKYIEKPYVEWFEGIEAFMGSRVHEAMEGLYRSVRFSRIPSKEELIQDYHRRWVKNYSDEVRIVKKVFTADNYRLTGEKALAEYYDRHHPFDDGKSIGIEFPIYFKLGGEEGPGIRGYIDRLVYKDDGKYEIHDYKTSGSCPDQKAVDADRQLALYQLGIREKFPDAADIELVWHYMIFGMEFRSRRSEDQLNGLIGETKRLIGTIENDSVFQTKVSALCDWCEYKSICPAWVHLIETEEMDIESFDADDGVRMVDELANVERQLEFLKIKKEELEERLKAFALAKDVSRVIGHTHIANVRKSMDVIFPKSGDPDYNGMISLIKQHNLWDELSQLSASRLKSGFKKMIWPESFRNEIGKLTKESHTIKINLARKKDPE